MDKIDHEPLTFQRAAVVRRVDALFRAMSSDFLLREQFITDPAQILSEYVYTKKMPPEEASLTNHLIYSIMSSRDLVRWFRDRAFQLRNQTSSNDSFVSEFSRAVVQHGSHNLVLALIRNPAASAKIAAFDGSLLLEIIRTVLQLDSGTEKSTDTHGTQHSTGGGTEHSLAKASLLRADSGTEKSTDTHGTQHSTGGGTEHSLAKASLLRADSGTEKSTNGGTQQSGTHTTEHSTGGGGTRGYDEIDLIGNSYARVTLDALFQYASNLQKLGLLDNVGGQVGRLENSAK